MVKFYKAKFPKMPKICL